MRSRLFASSSVGVRTEMLFDARIRGTHHYASPPVDNRVLTVTGAAKSFGDVSALAGADLTLERGEWIGLLGPNGAGKTTLVRSVAGRVRLDAGSITLLGEALNGATSSLNHLGLVPQEIALYPELTADENLRTWGALSGVAKAELGERVDWALEWSGLAERAGKRVKTFSGGMQRRLNVACGILHRPEVVLLDEPTVGVDPQSRERIWEMLEALRRDGASLLLTTHQLDEADRVCDRIVILDHGRVIAEGTSAVLKERTAGAGASLQDVFIHLTGRELRE